MSAVQYVRFPCSHLVNRKSFCSAAHILSVASSSMCISLVARPRRRQSELTVTAVTWPCHKRPEPSTLPSTARACEPSQLFARDMMCQGCCIDLELCNISPWPAQGVVCGRRSRVQFTKDACPRCHRAWCKYACDIHVAFALQGERHTVAHASLPRSHCHLAQLWPVRQVVQVEREVVLHKHMDLCAD